MADIYVATTGSDSTGNGSSGNPYATPGKAGSVMSGGDRVLIKAGTYTLTSTSSNVAGGVLVPAVGTSAAPSIVVGYNSAVGDLDSINDFSNFPVLAASASFAVAPLQANNAYAHIYNIDVNGASQTSRGLWVQANNTMLVNCRARNTTFFGLNIDGQCILRRCMGDGNVYGIYISSSTSRAYDCVAKNNTTAGIRLDAYADIKRCLIYNNTGASCDGLLLFGAIGLNIVNCTFYNNGRDGIHLNDASGADNVIIGNSIFYSNGAYGINSATTNYTDHVGFFGNAYGANGTASIHNIPAGVGDVTLSADPFTNKAAEDFSLNSTVGGGAACLSAGLPGVFPLGLTTGYVSIGAVEKQNTGGTGTTTLIGITGFTGGFGE